MLANNRFFGATAATRMSGLAPSQNGLLSWQAVCRRADGFGPTAAVPAGYGKRAKAMPAKAGAMSSYQGLSFGLDAAADGALSVDMLASVGFDVDVAADAVGLGVMAAGLPFGVLLTAPVQGEAPISAVLGFSATLTAVAEASISGSAALAFGVDVAGDVVGEATTTAAASFSVGLAAVVYGSRSTTAALSFGVNLSAVSYGIGLMVATTEPASQELTAAQISAAVWAALAASNTGVGTMGELLNGAGGGSSPGAVAAAVRAELAAELARIDAAISTRIAAGGTVAADVRAVNGVAITGAGVPGNSMRPA